MSCFKKSAIKLNFMMFVLIVLLTTGTMAVFGGRVNEIVFIDDALQDYKILMDSVPEGVQVVVLDSKKDGIEQMATYLQNKGDLAALHFVSHGSVAEIHVGTTVLNSQTLESYSEKLDIIGQSLKATGNIHIYGCNVAQGGEGQAFVDKLARITGADIAASEDATGSSMQGGNWILEYQSGIINVKNGLFSNMDIYPFLLEIDEDLIHTYSSNTWAFNSLAVGPDGTIYLAHKLSTTAIAVKSWNGISWTSLPGITIADTGDTSYSDDLDLAVSSDGKLHLVFKNNKVGSIGIKYGVYDAINWQFTEIDTYAVGILNTPQISVDSFDDVHIVYRYVDDTDDYIKYATNHSGSWVKSTVVTCAKSGTDELHVPRVVIDDNDVVHVSYVREDNQNDYYGNYYYTSKNRTDATFPLAQKLVDSVSEGKYYQYTPLVCDGDALYFTSYDSDWATGESTSYLHTNQSGSWQREQVYFDNVRDTVPIGIYAVNSNLYLLMDSWSADWTENYYFAMANYGSGWITGTTNIDPDLIAPIDEKIFVVDSDEKIMLVTEHDQLKKISSLIGTSTDFGLDTPAPTSDTAQASADTLTPVAGAEDVVTLTVKDTLNNTDTSFSGAKNVTITGVAVASDATYGSFNGTTLDASSAGAGQVISVAFTEGVATPNLKLNKADGQTIGFSIDTVTTPATNDLVITPVAGVASTLELTTQPVTGSVSGDVFATQPVVKLKDQYGNDCTTGVSATANVVATAKEGTGTWSIGGTTTRAAVGGIATFTNLTCTLSAVGDGSITLASGDATVDSTTFDIPQNVGKVLTADTTDNDVDHDLEITFGADATFEGAITAVTYNGNTLTSNQYTVSSGKLTLHPSVDDNAYLRTPGTGNVVIVATGYDNSTVSQMIDAGVASTLELTTQPVTGSVSGDAFATQPVVKLKDQYGNDCTTGVSVTANVVATAKEGTGTWSIGGTTTRAAVGGIATFTNLTCTLSAVGDGSITLASGDATVDSTTFDIPQNVGKVLTADTTDNDVDHDLEITFGADATFEGAITAVTYNGNTLTSNQYTVSSGKLTLHPSNDDNAYLRTPGTGNIVIVATGYDNSTVSQTIDAGVASTLELTTQPVTGSVSGDAFATQPVVKLKDQYGNDCTAGVSATANVVATAKEGTGTWSIGGTTTRAAVGGIATFTNLTCTLSAVGDGSITLASGDATVDSTTFDIPQNVGKVLTADTTDNDVDHDLEITFGADATFEGAITAVTYNGNTLTSNQYTVSSGKLTLHPSNDDNAYLRTPGTGNIVIVATGYDNSTVSQTIDAGVASTLELTTQPVTGSVSGDAFATQPVVKLKDQYGNDCTAGVSATANVVATAKEGTGTWSIGGTTTRAAVGGIATFTNLTCTLSAVGDGSITLASGDATVDSTTFDIPQNVGKVLTADTTDNDVDHDLEITFGADATFEGAITAVTYNGNTLTSNQYTVSSGKLTLHPSNDDNAYLRTPGTGNVVIVATGYDNSTVSQTIDAGVASTLELTTQPVTGSVSGDAFATQPVVKLKDQYGNDCTAGVSATANVVATAKEGTGTWSIGGTTTRAAVGGIATFTNLTCTLSAVGDGSITLASGDATVDSTTFDIPQNVGKVLTADTTDNDVDHDLEITFGADATFEGAVTAVTYNGNTLTSNQYTVASGKLTLHPSNDDNAYLRTPGTGNVVIVATGYDNSTVSQTIDAGVASTLELTTQPVTGSVSGDAFATQPVVKLKDQYGNDCTTGVSVTANVVATAKEGTGTWSIGGTTMRTTIDGIATFTDLICILSTVGDGSITFTSGTATVDSTTFDIPQNVGKVLTADTTNNDVDHDLEITFAVDVTSGGAITAVTYNGNTLTSNQYTVTSDKLMLHPSADDNAYLRTPGTGNIVIVATGYENSTVPQTINAGVASTLELITQPVTGSVSGDAFATQPVVKLKDQYGNDCTTGVSATANVVATAKESKGTWIIGGTSARAAVGGIATFTDLTCTLSTVGNGSIIFTSGAITVESTPFDIPQNVGKVITADTTDNDVDHDLEITFGADATFEGAITAVTYNGNTLTSNQYTVSSGKLTLHPSVDDNAYLRTPSTGDLAIVAAGYEDIIVSQTINYGAIVAIELNQMIAAPTTNGGQFAQQPVIALKDQYNNICTGNNSTKVTVSRNDAGEWTLTGNTTATAQNGIVTFVGIGVANTVQVSDAKLAFNSSGLPELISNSVTLPGSNKSDSGDTSDSSNPSPSTPPTTPQANQDKVIVIVNGIEQDAGKETTTTENGKTTVTIEVKNEVIESKIGEAVKNNTTGIGNLIQVTVANTTSEVAKVELTGDIVKKLEENKFNVSAKRGNVEYIIPAEEFTISKIAENLGVTENDLVDIKVEVKFTKLDESVIAKYNEVTNNNGAELIFPPISFEVMAKTTKADGSTGEVSISKFSNYVERVMELSTGVDPNKITTGIVFNADGTYSHVPTSMYQRDGKWYASLNSLTNSNYAVIWNESTIKAVENHWAQDAVNDMASRLVIFNTEKFEPNKAITRADFTEYIVRALGLYRAGSTHENNFKDVSSTGERTLAILIANENEIVTGFSDETFRPDQQITREEAMVMYRKAMKIAKLTGSDTSRYQNYVDYETVSSWAKTYVQEVLSAHVFNGTSETTISPKANLTYAEAAQAIKNLLVESKMINK